MLGFPGEGAGLLSEFGRCRGNQACRDKRASFPSPPPCSAQAEKATNFQPHIASEIEHLLQKLQELQSQSDGFKLELKRKESHFHMLTLERERLRNQISVANETHSKEKQALVDKITELNRRKEQKDSQISAKEIEILHAKQELEQQQMNLSNKEQTILELQGKVKQQVEQQKEVESRLSEKRREFLKMQSAMHEMEDKIFKKTAAMQEHITHNLRSEISVLHQQLLEQEFLSEQDQLLRSKMVDDCATLTKENAMMQSRLLAFNKQIEMERILKEESYKAHSASTSQFLAMKDNEKHLKEKIQRHQQLMEQEDNTVQDLHNKISILEKGSTCLDLNIATMRNRIIEFRAMLDKEEQDNMELKRDKSLLIDLAFNLQKQLLGEENNFLHASNKMLELDEAISALKVKHIFCRSIPTEKSDEISKMVKSMKDHKSMTDTIINIGKY